jgi:hypothetical protein
MPQTVGLQQTSLKTTVVDSILNIEMCAQDLFMKEYGDDIRRLLLLGLKDGLVVEGIDCGSTIRSLLSLMSGQKED